jgi:hypothetical protein
VIFWYVMPCSLAQCYQSVEGIAIYQTKRLHKKFAVSSSILSKCKVYFCDLFSPTTLLNCELSDTIIVPTSEFSTTSVLVEG